MGSLTGNEKTTVPLAAGQRLTVTLAADSVGSATSIGNPGSGEGAHTVLTAGATTKFGPFAVPKTYELRCEGGSLSYTAAVPDPTELAQEATEESAGTAAAGVTAVEAGNAVDHLTTLTVDTVLPAIAGGAALAVGVLAYTLPAGRILIQAAGIDLAITQTEDNITADTPEIGLGTLEATGAEATLGDVGAAAENIVGGQVAADCDGTATLKTLAPGLVIEAADDHTVYINVADTWAADGDAAAALTGTAVLRWTLLG